jgi:hypothetical protein
LNVALLVFVSLTVFLGVVDLFRGRH